MKFSTASAIIARNVKIWTYKAFRQTHRLKPYKVLVSLTNQCNSRCEYCDIWKINPENPSLYADELRLEDLERMFADLKGNLIWLALSGGEITLVKYFKEMIVAAQRHCPNLRLVSFTTNALAPARAQEYAEFIRDQGLDVFVTISLDGDEEFHDRVRGIKGNFAKCVRLYGALNDAGIPVHYGITVADENYQFIRDHYAVQNDDIKSVTFVHSGGIYEKENPVDYDRIRQGLRHIYDNYKIDHLSEILEKIHIKISMLFLDEPFSKNIIPCEVMNTSAHIMPHGEVQPCMFMPKIGNIKSDHLADIYSSPEAHRVREEIRRDQCPKCWMNCYSPFSMMQHPLKSLTALVKRAGS